MTVVQMKMKMMERAIESSVRVDSSRHVYVRINNMWAVDILYKVQLEEKSFTLHAACKTR